VDTFYPGYKYMFSLIIINVLIHCGVFEILQKVVTTWFYYIF